MVRRIAGTFLFFLIFLSSASARVLTPDTAPGCQDVSMFVVALNPSRFDYRFRLILHNDSTEPILLAPLLPNGWELDRFGSRAWTWYGGGGLGPGWSINSSGRFRDDQYIRIEAGRTFTKTFEQPDLFGEDEPGPAPGTHYRVIFTYWYKPSAGEKTLGLLPCSIQANPVEFVEAPQARRKGASAGKRVSPSGQVWPKKLLMTPNNTYEACAETVTGLVNCFRHARIPMDYRKRSQHSVHRSVSACNPILCSSRLSS